MPSPFSRDEFFAGREGQLPSLEKLLFRQDSHQRVTIFGLGGCRKSALALECTYRVIIKDANYLVFWVPATVTCEISGALSLYGLDRGLVACNLSSPRSSSLCLRHAQATPDNKAGSV